MGAEKQSISSYDRHFSYPKNNYVEVILSIYDGIKNNIKTDKLKEEAIGIFISTCSSFKSTRPKGETCSDLRIYLAALNSVEEFLDIDIINIGKLETILKEKKVI